MRVDPKTSVNLVEREADLAAALAVLERARAGRGSLVAVECEAGGGKTSLIEAVATKARADGFHVLRAHGVQFESSLEFGTVRRLFDQVPESVLAQAPAAASAVLRPTGEEQDGQDEYACWFALFWICAELSEKRPVVVVVDDAQWADEASVGFLRFVRERADDLAIALVVGTRPVAAVDTALAHLVNDPRTALVRPVGLSTDGAAAVLRATLPELSDAVCAAAQRATGGNPYFVGSVLSELVVNPDLTAEDVARLVPEVVTRAMLSRVSALPGRALDVARAVAILGEDSEPRFVAGLVGIPAAEVLATADLLHTSGILTDSRPLELLHPIMRTAVLAGMSTGQVSLDRRRAAEVLVDGDAPAVRVSLQLLETEPLGDPWVVDQLVRGAESLRGAGRHRVATTLLRRALAEPPAADRRGLVLAALGTAERHILAPEAIAHLGEALPLVPHGQGIAAKVVFELAAAYESRGRLGEAVRLLDKVRAVASAEPGRLDGLETALVGAFAAGMRIVGMMPSVPEDVRAAEARIAELAGTGREARVIAAMVAADLCLRGTEPDQGARALEVARIAVGPGLPPEDLALPLTYGVLPALVAAGDPRAAIAAVDLDAVARTTGSPWASAGVAAWLAYARLNTGELADADADLAEAIEYLAAGTAPVGLAAAVAFQAEVDLERRGPGAARATLERYRAAIGELTVAQFAFCLRADATVALAEGDPLAAGIAARRLGDLVEAAAMSAPSMFPWRLQLAQAESALGRTVAAERWVAEHLGLVRTFGERAAVADALVAAASMAEAEDAQRLLEEALASATENPLALARALEAHGEHLLTRDERDRGRESLERAFDLADRARADWRRARLAERLSGLGVAVRRTPEAARDQLTPSELRTCRLAQDGLTNREIAQSLFVSTKTVETHLRAAFRKLGVGSRQELGAVLTEV